MARIVRKNQKIFAEDASNNGVFGSLQSNDPVTSSDPDVIQSRTAFSNGWNDATYSSELLPPLEEFQGLQYLFSRQLAYIFQEGLSEWNTDTVYFKGSVVKAIDDADIKIYVSLTDNNSGNLVTDTTKWKMVFDSSAPYADYYFSNLSSVAKNIGNWSTNLSNCITQIPQDIKLELNAGTLTLKAGSKVYVPNGAGVFDTITISSDLNLGAIGSYTGSGLLFVKNDGTQLIQQVTNISGTTAPSGDGSWYDTTNNLIKVYSGGSDTGIRLSLPIAQIHRTSGTWDNIEQIFNGFGYIGSSAFSLPNVSGLVPNGRNADGTLKNIPYTVPSVIVRTWTYESVNQPLCLNPNTDFLPSVGHYYASSTEPCSPSVNYVLWYNPDENICKYSSNNGVWTETTDYLPIGITTSSDTVANGYKLTQFTTPKTVFHAFDWNDTKNIVGYPLPNLLSGVSRTVGTQYTAGHNGWLNLFGGGGGNGGAGAQGGCNITINGTTFSISNTIGEARTWSRCWFPIPKGTIYKGALGTGVNQTLEMTWYPCIGG